MGNRKDGWHGAKFTPNLGMVSVSCDGIINLESMGPDVGSRISIVGTNICINFDGRHMRK